ncbi:hypothetical protein DVH24_034744 [Malus domestica]|uniref:Uncharacterized protein n=1 Tax=Malus domestica TaxID=3750 RepID=A0A498J0G2_MALDO|nr:hypothetical protein DVH24_034744 [Malus domestica]
MRGTEMSQVRYKECNLLRGNDFVFLAYRTDAGEMANKKMEEERGFDNSRNISETEPSTSRIKQYCIGRENIVQEVFHEASSNYGYKAEVPSNLDREMENSIGITSQE